MPQKTVEPRHKAVHISRVLLYIAVVLSSLTTLAFFIRFSFWFELFTTYAPQLLFLNLGLFLLCLGLWILKVDEDGWTKVFELHRSVPVLLVILLALSINNFYLSTRAPTYASTTKASSGRTLTVMSFNKLYNNTLDAHALSYIANQSPDILAFEEIFKAEAQVIAEELGYTHWHIAACGCSAYGSDLALFSRFPFGEVDIAFEDRLGGFLRGEIVLGHDDMAVVYVAHVIPPYGSSAYAIRPQMFKELAKQINSETDPVLLMGDFNSTMYSIDMRNLAADIAAKTRPIGDRPFPKCSWFGYSSLLCARIDHIFIPEGSLLVEEQIGPNIGSDHRPVEALIAL